MEPFIKRQLLIDKLEREIVRVDRSIHLQEVQTLIESKHEVRAIRQHFEDAHVAYISKTRKIEITDPDQRDLFNKVMDRAQGTLDNISIFLTRNKEEKEAERMNDLYQEIISDMSQEEETLQMTLESRVLPDPERESCLQEMSLILLKFDNIKKIESQLLEHYSSADKRKHLKARTMKMKTELLIGQKKLKLLLASAPVASTSLGGRGEGQREVLDDHQSSKPTLNSSSSNYNGGNLGSVDPLEENVGRALPAVARNVPANKILSYSDVERMSTPGLGNNRFKAKKLDFPKFNGNLHNYNSFKHDFKTIVESSLEYTLEQMSVILRTECLVVGTKHLVENIFEYREIWNQLDRDYDDEGRVIQQIIQQITDFKEIHDENKEAFIQFVDLILEANTDLILKANTDIQAYTASAILAHPVIVP